MQQIKLWALTKEADGSLTAQEVRRRERAQAESQLEDLLVKKPDLLMEGLKLVGRQTATPGGPLDLLGVDEDGEIVVFELKRGTLSREAVAQIIDYTSYLAQLEPRSLAQHIAERSGQGGIPRIEDFAEWYRSNYPREFTELVEAPRLALVGLGADERTRRMVDFLTRAGVNMSLITFHAFERDGQVFLARQVELAEPERIESPKYTKEQNLEAMKALAREKDAETLVLSAAAYIREQVPSAYEYPVRSGFSYSLSEQTDEGKPTYRVYVSLYVASSLQRTIQVVFQQRAIDAAQEGFHGFQKAVLDKLRIEKTPTLLMIYVKGREERDLLFNHLKPVLRQMLEGYQRKMAKLRGETTEEQAEESAATNGNVTG